MKTAKIIILAGIVVMTLGIVFHLQGQARLGPESSFMYSSPEWTTYGMQILAGGAVITGIGTTWKIITRSSL